ncbi:MAG: DUF354 domain-containing protein [Solirubrobacterales bacterium]
MRVWIDLANSPHAALFEPIARRLEAGGAEVLITARDHAQTLELGTRIWPELDPVGGRSPSSRVRKAAAVGGRVQSLRRWARSRLPDVALSHNSYAQIVAARSLGIPAVTGMDYEHQPANHLAFRLAQSILMPELLPGPTVRRQGARATKVIRYPGFKEEVYLGDFEPDPDLRRRLGVGEDELLVVARAAPAGAAYHRGENPIFTEALRRLAQPEGRRTVVLARHPSQRVAVEALGLPRVTVPERPLEGRALLAAADVFCGAGGTMSREAALLGTPTVSVFSGAPAAVDRELERRGLMLRIGDRDGLERLERVAPGRSEPIDPGPLRARGRLIERAFCNAVLAAAGGSPRRVPASERPQSPQ